MKSYNDLLKKMEEDAREKEEVLLGKLKIKTNQILREFNNEWLDKVTKAKPEKINFSAIEFYIELATRQEFSKSRDVANGLFKLGAEKEENAAEVRKAGQIFLKLMEKGYQPSKIDFLGFLEFFYDALSQEKINLQDFDLEIMHKFAEFHKDDLREIWDRSYKIGERTSDLEKLIVLLINEANIAFENIEGPNAEKMQEHQLRAIKTLEEVEGRKSEEESKQQENKKEQFASLAKKHSQLDIASIDIYKQGIILEPIKKFYEDLTALSTTLVSEDKKQVIGDSVVIYSYLHDKYNHQPSMDEFSLFLKVYDDLPKEEESKSVKLYKNDILKKFFENNQEECRKIYWQFGEKTSAESRLYRHLKDSDLEIGELPKTDVSDCAEVENVKSEVKASRKSKSGKGFNLFGGQKR